MTLAYSRHRFVRFLEHQDLRSWVDGHVRAFDFFQGVPETVLIDNPEIAPQGCGEPACTTVSAVLANAICDATGVRLFELPMTPERIKEAVSQLS